MRELDAAVEQLNSTIAVIAPPTEVLETLWQDEGLVLYRSVSEVDRSRLLVVASAVEQPGLGSLKRLEEEYALRDELDRLCLERIARFKRPRDYIFVAELPKNNNGKVVKTALRERVAAPPNR